jgi:hypothetical protein
VPGFCVAGNDEGHEPPTQELRSLPREELIARHDQLAQDTGIIGVNYDLEELARRNAADQTATMVRLTWTVAI